MKRDEVEVPTKFKGGIAEEAYTDGYLAGLDDKIIESTMVSMMGELSVELLDKGMKAAMTDKGIRGIAERAGKRLGKHARLANQLADVVDAVRKVGRKS
jgi:hypothetical protein